MAVGPLVIQGIITLVGYLYPAYLCFKCIESKRPGAEDLRFWCKYWVIVALITVFENLLGALLPWVPMYLEAKLAFVVYLWYPNTKGVIYIYKTFVKPNVAKYEQDIDEGLNDVKARAGQYANIYWQRASAYLQPLFREFLLYLASQAPRPPNAPPGAGAPGPQVQMKMSRQSSRVYAG
jgi:receptor expression-enhancing protein 1/2/3/4